MSEVTIPTNVARELHDSRREAKAFKRAERRLNAHRPTFEQVKARWVENARLHAMWILSPKCSDSYSDLRRQTVRTLRCMDSDPENKVVHGRGQEIYEAYVAELDSRVPEKYREVYPSFSNNLYGD